MTPGRRRRRRERLLRAGVGLGAVLVALGAWQAVAWTNPVLNRYLSSPTAVLAVGAGMVVNGELWRDLEATLTVYAIGLVTALVLGLAAGVVLGWYRTAYAVANPLLQLYNTLPSTVLVPILMIVLGLGTASKVAITILAASKAVVFNMIAGVRNVDPALVRVSRSFGASDGQVLRLVVLPSTLPYLAAALRQAGGLAMLGVVVGEFFVAGAGVGSLILRASFSVRSAEMFVGIFTLIAVALAIDSIFRLVQARVRKW